MQAAGTLLKQHDTTKAANDHRHETISDSQKLSYSKTPWNLDGIYLCDLYVDLKSGPVSI